MVLQMLSEASATQRRIVLQTCVECTSNTTTPSFRLCQSISLKGHRSPECRSQSLATTDVSPQATSPPFDVAVGMLSELLSMCACACAHSHPPFHISTCPACFATSSNRIETLGLQNVETRGDMQRRCAMLWARYVSHTCAHQSLLQVLVVLVKDRLR